MRHIIITVTQYATQKAPPPRSRSCGLSPEPHRGLRVSKCLPQLTEQYAPSHSSLCLHTTVPLLTPPRPACSKPNHRLSPCQRIQHHDPRTQQRCPFHVPQLCRRDGSSHGLRSCRCSSDLPRSQWNIQVVGLHQHFSIPSNTVGERNVRQRHRRPAPGSQTQWFQRRDLQWLVAEEHGCHRCMYSSLLLPSPTHLLLATLLTIPG